MALLQTRIPCLVFKREATAKHEYDNIHGWRGGGWVGGGVCMQCTRAVCCKLAIIAYLCCALRNLLNALARTIEDRSNVVV